MNEDYSTEMGPLGQTYQRFVIGTHCTGSQISIDRIADERLHSGQFYVSNVALATKRGGKLLLGISLTSSVFDVVFEENPQLVCDSLINAGYIKLDTYQKNLVLSLERKKDVVFVDSDDMWFQRADDKHMYFSISPHYYMRDSRDSYPARMPFVNAGYGSDEALERVMRNLEVRKIQDTRIFTMNPEHAEAYLKEEEIIARACRIGSFDRGSNFFTDIRYVDDHDWLRGLLP